MRPLRRQMLVGWLALIAMTLQLMLSLGHFHSHDHVVAGASPPSASTGSVGASQPPADNDDESHCAICWAMAAVRLAVLGSPAAIPLPQFQDGVRLAVLDSALVAQGCPSPFQARGPPIATIG